MWKKAVMLKKIICLFVLVLLASCAAKQDAASPEDVLKEIAASRWEIDVDASLKIDSAAREEIEKIGRDKFVAGYGQLGFGIDTVERVLVWYAVRETAADTMSFAVAPETAEEAAERKSGARQVRLIMNGDENLSFVLRYDGAGKLLFFMNDGKDELIGVFAPLGK